MTTSSDTGFLVDRPEPEQRVWALRAAREVLRHGPAFGTAEISVIDLVDISQYILTGVDPYAVAQDTTAEAPTG